MILFNYIFTFYCGQKKVKTTNYKTANINGIKRLTKQLREVIVKESTLIQALTNKRNSL